MPSNRAEPTSHGLGIARVVPLAFFELVSVTTGDAAERLG